MPFPKGSKSNHPACRLTIQVEPIRDKRAIAPHQENPGPIGLVICACSRWAVTGLSGPMSCMSLKVGQVKNLQEEMSSDTEARKDAQVPPSDAECYCCSSRFKPG
jgi:hypothetical protein